MSLKPLFTY